MISQHAWNPEPSVVHFCAYGRLRRSDDRFESARHALRPDEGARRPQANITYVDIIPHLDRDAEIYLEFSADGDIDTDRRRTERRDRRVDASR